MNHRAVNDIIKACAILWPAVPFQTLHGEPMVRLWQLALADITMAEAEQVLILASRHGDKFPPAPGEVARRALDARARAAGTLAPDVDVAWLSVIGTVRKRGWYSGPPDSYGHPAVEAAARSLGWNRLCLGDEMVTMAHFKNLYQAAATRTEQQRQEAETMAMLGGVAALPAAALGELPTA